MATTVHQKIRIYDLAKELKLDNKKVLEDARREGIDVSVPSNTVPHEVAESIRLKYFPKKIAPQAGPRLVKHVKPIEPAEPQIEEMTEPEAAIDEVVEVAPGIADLRLPGRDSAVDFADDHGTAAPVVNHSGLDVVRTKIH